MSAIRWIKLRMLPYGVAILIVALATLLRVSIDPTVQNNIPFTFYYAAVMIAAWYAGWGPALLALILGGLLGTILFAEPRGSIVIYSFEQQVEVVLYGFVGLVVIVLTEGLKRSRRRAEAARDELAKAKDLAHQARAAAEAANRAKDRFLAILSHELRTPLTPIEMGVSMLEDRADLDGGVTAKMMRWALTEDGHEVTTAGDVATALELAGRNAFDLLVSDLGLPDGSGYELIHELRRRGREFPAIALSGYGQEQDIERSKEAGFAVHLIKPASRERLLEAVASAGGTAVAHDQKGGKSRKL